MRCVARLSILAQSAQSQSSQRQAEIAQRDVVVTGNGQEINDDKQQPKRDYVGKEPRFNKDPYARDDLDDTHDTHELMAMVTQDIVRDRGEVFIPVNEQMKELIE